MGDKKINMTLVTLKGCIHCAQTKDTLKKLKPDYPDLEVTEIDVTSPRGKELVSKYSIMSNPGIIINDELFSVGGTTEKDLRKKFDEIINK